MSSLPVTSSVPSMARPATRRPVLPSAAFTGPLKPGSCFYRRAVPGPARRPLRASSETPTTVGQSARDGEQGTEGDSPYRAGAALPSTRAPSASQRSAPGRHNADSPAKSSLATMSIEEEDAALSQSFKKELRATARRELAAFDAKAAIEDGDKRYWLVATVPEVPVAGEKCRLYFNRQQSESLRERPRVQVHYAFNRWELNPKDGGWVDLVPSGIPFYEGGDWWSTEFQVPEDAFEMNFVFDDGEGAFENNAMNDFMYAISGGITAEDWEEQAAARAAAEDAARRKAEEEARIAAEKAEKERKLAADLEAAQNIVNELSWKRDEFQAGGLSSLTHGEGPDAIKVWSTEPKVLTAGSSAVLRYNSKAGPLHWVEWAAGMAPILKMGHNFWQNAKDYKMKKVAGVEKEGECWWEASINVPEDAAAINFVFNHEDMYDNNNSLDFKALVELPASVTSMEAYKAELLEKVRARIHKERIAAEEAEAIREQKRLEKRLAVMEKSMEVSRKQIKHVLFTEPVQPAAGQQVTMFYNPNNTNLAGCEDIYISGGFNRWGHRKSFNVKMIPPKAGEHFQAVIDVPADAYSLDFVFADVPGGDGTYDNRGGLDYHLPTTGSPTKENPMYVCHISVEMAPIAKVGGLGDVVTSLGRAVSDMGHYVEVVLPKYQFFNHSPLLQNMEYDCEFDWGGTKIFVTKAQVEGLQCFFIEPRNGMFNVDAVYGRYDDAVRFDFFCKAALEFLLQSQRQPDIIHTHDWPTAMAAKFFWEDYHSFGLWKPKVVFTIHNMNYGQSRITEAAIHCQKFTTVSPTYAFEIGGHAAIGAQNMKLRGIRNGIDPDLWDPESDIFLPMHYNSSNVVEGKRAAKEQLRQRLGLSGWEAEKKPMIGVVTRLTGQKGVHLIKHCAHKALERGGQFVLLGSAPDPKIQADFNSLQHSMQGENAAFYFAFDEPLSHLIYAACDIIVVPSMFEPCGLTQMIAMRYGTVPVVRSTGGLRDTVFDVDCDKARAAWEMEGSSDWEGDGVDATNGFAFEGTDDGALDYALNRAVDAFYNDRAWFESLQARCMDQDWTWNRPALEYLELYHQARK